MPFPHDNPEGIARVRQRLPWYVPHVATQGPTIDPEEGVEVFTSAYPLLVSMADLDEDMVYGITKVISVHYDEYKNSAPGANGWRIDGQQLENAFIPYHEGAIRYFKEVGIWTPEAEERQQQNLYRQEVLKEAWDTFLPTAPEDREAFAEAWLEVRANHLAENGLITLSDSQ